MSQQRIQEAKQILLNNWREGYTIPSARLYPFQWNWDSGFICLGYIHFDMEKAIEEFRHLFKGQWSNGFLPHILFHKEAPNYFPNADFWGSAQVPEAPADLPTSGIGQPPVHGFVLENILRKLPENQAEELAKELFPKVKLLHQYYYENRDPLGEGLVYINHPWESGRDNSPLWNAVYAHWELKEDEVPPYKRVDNKRANPEERPTKDDYDRYVYLVDLGKKHLYQDQEIYLRSPFLVQDTLYNAILLRSTQSMRRIGKRYGFEQQIFATWEAKAQKAFNEKLWSEELQCYLSYDLRNDKAIPLREIGGLLSLFAGIPDEERTLAVIETILNKSFTVADGEGAFHCPTFDAKHPSFVPHRYWRGPIWINTNWMLYQGLLDYEYEVLASKIRQDSLDLIEKLGFFEYFDARKSIVQKGKGAYGSNAFSWSAALYLDFIHTR